MNRIPSEFRPYLTINTKRAVELDYSGIQPNILYAQKGCDPPDDPYNVGLDSIHIIAIWHGASPPATGVDEEARVTRRGVAGLCEGRRKRLLSRSRRAVSRP